MTIHLNSKLNSAFDVAFLKQKVLDFFANISSMETVSTIWNDLIHGRKVVLPEQHPLFLLLIAFWTIVNSKEIKIFSPKYWFPKSQIRDLTPLQVYEDIFIRYRPKANFFFFDGIDYYSKLVEHFSPFYYQWGENCVYDCLEMACFGVFFCRRVQNEKDANVWFASD